MLRWTNDTGIVCIKIVCNKLKNASPCRNRETYLLALARHSFAVNLLNNGANIKTVASLLGHAGLKHTEKYTRAVDSLKREAIDSLPDISF